MIKNMVVRFCLILIILLVYHQVFAQQFNYQYSTEIVHNDQRGKLLPYELELFAKKKFGHLNHSIFFDPSFIKDARKIREYHLRDQYLESRRGQLLEFQTEDKHTIHATYFNRNSDKLLVVGEGFTNSREVMSPFIDMFTHYDLIIFDFRGHGLDTRAFSLSKHVFGVDAKHAQLGMVEELDVFAVIDGMKKRKHYSQVYGLGICYSAFIFLKAEALRNGIFNKLILDGCWVSVPLVIEKLRQDPKLICDPQFGGWASHWLLGDYTVQEVLLWITTNILGLSLNQISLLDYLKHVREVELLFFYGKDDLMVKRSEFESIWSSITGVTKTAIITSNPHVRNHLKQKELYCLLCELFLNHNHQKFKEFLSDEKAMAVAQLYSNQLLNFMT